jgi:hypothetical protein
MIGRSGQWQAIGNAFSPPMTPAAIKNRLNGVVTRRNQIVHEGDYRRLERPRGPGQNLMLSTRAAADIQFISDLINAIHAVV